jgi:hypothetical protein
MLLAATAVQAQISIAGNVYGGGNAGNLGGSTNVKVYAGRFNGSVFGGARQADVAGCTYVNIDGENMSGDIIVNAVYGGNDISGTIGSLENIGSNLEKPDTRIDRDNHHSSGSEQSGHEDHSGLKDVSTFILTTPERKETTVTNNETVTTQPYHIFIGRLFGGGNGDYSYTVNSTDAYKWDVTLGENNIIRGIDKPHVARAYVDLHGGTFGSAYAGGNNATVTRAANICINNTSTPWKLAGVDNKVGTTDDVISDADLQAMGINTEFFNQMGKYNFSSVFGGNNKAAMSIRPSWHLNNGSIENLYSGGNEGAMNSPDGILLVVQPDDGGNLTVTNVFAGCRKAPVRPLLDNGQEPEVGTIEGYKFPSGLAARVLIKGGNITNVYGGNDITGKVSGGSAIGIYSSIKGCVYGGGNGSYAYTDNPALKTSPKYGDFYYNVDSLLKQKYSTWADGDFAKLSDIQKSFKSAEALNLFRPNAEQVSLRLHGTEAKPTVIGGAVYLGGNSATLKPVKSNYRIELKIGSHVYSDSVFLANNGANMINADILSRYNGTVKDVNNEDQDYSQMAFLSTDQDATDQDETNTGKTTFAKYMDGVVMEAGPRVVFDGEDENDPDTYKDYSTYFGSFYCGGNVGSMRNNATTEINVNYKVIIFDKLVGGSNKALVPAGTNNVEYRGGLLGLAPGGAPKLKLNLSGLKLQPKRWKNVADKSQLLEWNTISSATGEKVDFNPSQASTGTSTAADMDRRFTGGNIYGGCYESGHVNGDVVINVNGSLVDREGTYGVFDSVAEDTLGEAILYGHENYNITARRSGVILDEQGMDVLGTALNLFAGGYGKDSEIWGRTTVNLNRGYMFQIFGGSEQGVIGKSTNDGGTGEGDDYTFNGKTFRYNPAYSTVINVHGRNPGASKRADSSEDMAEAEFIYGGGFEGPIMGNTRINLGHGRVFNTFAGSCNADILGYTETYIGQWTEGTGANATTITGFPWVRDYTYGGNDLGGLIYRSKNYYDRLNEETISKIYKYDSQNNTNPYMLYASAYTEYKQGRVGGIFGGCYGDYDYSQTGPYWNRIDGDNEHKKLPYMSNAFVNLSPLADNDNNKANYLGEVYGAGQGRDGDRRGDKMQDFSYVLVDMPNTETFKDAVVFGAGSYNGVGMRQVVAPNATDDAKDQASAVVDLINGNIRAAYGGSYKQGITRRTVVNVPAESTINIGNIFGGAYGTMILPPCDVYETNVNYNNTSEKARLTGAIYGGNNNERRSIYTHVNITSPVWSNKEKGYLGTVYGAGKGVDTWSEYTEVNLESGAKVYEVYGGGQMGHVLNAESVEKYISLYTTRPSDTIAVTDPKWKDPARWKDGKVGGTTGALKSDYQAEWQADWKKTWTLDGYYDPKDDFTGDYIKNTLTNFDNVTARPELADDAETATLFKSKTKFNTHVIIKEGAVVEGYAYGGGLGVDSIPNSGDTYGTTYIALLGGVVKKDLYAAGTSGGVYDVFGAKNFIASANAYIQGGTARNVYGGGWKGNVGSHTGATVNGKYYAMAGGTTKDIDGETNVVIGIHQDHQSDIAGYGFTKGVPAIQRNAYGGGEGGAVFGTASLILRNGYVGYVHLDAGKVQNEKGEVVDATIPESDSDEEEAPDVKVLYPARYEAKINDETYYNKLPPYNWLGNKSLEDAGCVFGGGYIDNSSVDCTNVTVYGGQIRNSLFGGGEIAAIGRGLVELSTTDASGRQLTGIYKAGKTNVKLYEGKVNRNVFGGGRGYNNLGEHGTLNSDGFIFGQTEVHVYGGEVGTMAGVARGDGNVFGGGDVGYVYSAYNLPDGSIGIGKKSGVRYDEDKEGYYYKFENNAFVDGYKLTEDCKVVIEPWAKATADVTVNGHSYTAGKYVPTDDLNTLSAKTGDDASKWNNLDASGIIIHNAVFAGGNTSAGSSTANANTASVFGNATASIHDVYHRDLITLGTGHTGGLYGDGNLTLVDGYRELNITNYGTDYYTIEKEITIDQYLALPDREAAYYELRYTCLNECKDKDGTIYRPKDPANENSKASTITADDLLTLFLVETSQGSGVYNSVQYNNVDVLVYDEDKGWIPNKATGANFWKESGVLPVYAGRLMNSVQRADFCGVFGSRMVMQGARDRVPEITDFTNYTINRVREVSLNQQHSQINDDLTLKSGKTKATKFPEDQDPNDFVDLDKAIHGNYFGIYSVVNYLGALTSDVHFKPGTIAEGGEDIRRTDNTNTELYGPEKQKDAQGNIIYESDNVTPKLVGDDLTYYQWKAKHKKDRTRNNGSSFNKVALASGVYLELTTEKSTGKELNEKDWGYITGVVELDLINVQTGIGGGFVYAKNEHRVGSPSTSSQVTLTALNDGAISRKSYTYEGGAVQEFETSGNFVHSTQTIIDDCYNISGKFSGADAVPAHYWYIKGSVYVYDQYISAYTGSSNAYSETVEIPLTIAAASHGTMKLLNVQPNLYAYYASQGVELNSGKKLIINDVTYYKNDPISYWDYYLLSKSEKALFVPKTYVTVADCKWSENATDVIAADSVFLPNAYTTLKAAHPEVYHVALKKTVPFDEVFHESNNMSHDTGYLLTYKMNNPSVWDTWYTEKKDDHDNDGNIVAAHEKNQTGGNGYEDGPTYYLTSEDGDVLGQRSYKVSNLISKEVEDEYQKILKNDDAASWVSKHVETEATKDQATFELAYMVTNKAGISSKNWNYGYAMQASEVAVKQQDGSYTVKSEYVGSVAPAYICTSTIQMDKTEFIYLNSTMSETEKTGYITRVNTAMNAIASGASSMTTKAEIKALDITKVKKDSLLLLFDLKQDITEKIQPAYYCTEAGDYGGKWYESGVNYRGLEAWSSMSKGDRAKFAFNYDALDLLVDSTYSRKEGEKYQYDHPLKDVTSFDDESDVTNPAGYSITQPVDYTAEYNSNESLTLTTPVSVIGKTGTQSSLSKGDELLRTDFESLPNEQRHYTGIVVGDGKSKVVSEGYKVYVVNRPFQIGNTPYAVGTVLDANSYSGDMTGVTELIFATGDKGKTYYYCREKYEQGTAITAVPNSGESAPVAGTSVKGAGVGVVTEQGVNYVTIGTIIASGTDTGQYGSLPNDQKNFTIHGISPTETSTLYVSRESDIFDLSKEKIITAIYQYDFEESDTYGNITPVSERHVVNIHITFKSGVPTVEDIKAPQLVLPGSKVGLREPNVTPGAYEVTGGGWELFRTPGDAESHVNGKEFNQATDSLFWYQNDYYVAYYAKTYLGKTYSNHVQVSVANYHDLKKVMEAKKHHYYIDHQDVKREPKIYINDYSKDETGSKNGLDLMKQLFDLSLLEDKVSTDKNGLIDKELDDEGHATTTDSPFKGHKPLKKSMVGGCDNLEFILRTNIDHTPVTSANPDYDPENPGDTPETITTGSWRSIGSGSDPCFSGVLHGDGYYISGLDNSLFDKLCGQVYNLGVTGSFSDAGIAKTGKGYVENCWISTSSKAEKTGKPVFGDPTRSSADGDTYLKQVVNCYYQEEASGVTKPYSNTTDADHGNATRMSGQSFYNGEVAYNLNGFYLNKRYFDHVARDGSPVEYKYLKPNADGTLPTELSTGWYPNTYAYYPWESNAPTYGYVENRFANGDYIYAGGSIPDNLDSRIRTVKETIGGKEVDVTYYAPIWPDDYIYFGQALNYGHVEGRTHQDVPSHIAKSGDRLDLTESGNRIYRAPAYFRSSEMRVAHFNPYAVFAKTKKDVPGVKAYENMTAIDFTGNGETATYQQNAITTAPYANLENGAFFPPLLDDGGVRGFKNVDLTKNLLAYTQINAEQGHENDACNVTDATVAAALGEIAYQEGDATGEGYVEGKAAYRTVALSDPQYITGHWIQKSGENYIAQRDHQLVDKQDFNAPIGYQFDTGKRMWYQRMPDNYAGQEHNMDANGKPVFRQDAGWESISLPFTAELVTTDVKGEITHFYGTSTTGHEYWLREFKGKVLKDKQEPTDPDVYVANFGLPTAGTGSKDATNTFLWDYYYEAKATAKHNQKDKNNDTYQTYYNDERTYAGYPLLQGGKPYLIGFPGARYYEFDLSGGFEAFPTTATYQSERPEKLSKQTITFASNTGATIGVSDTEMNAVTAQDGYYHRPNYLNIEMPAGGYVMSYDGHAYNKLTADDVTAKKNKVSAFRTYFSTSATPQQAARRIIFNSDYTQLGEVDDDMKDKLGESLDIRPGKRSIVITSNLKHTADVRIFNVGGLCIANFDIEPGQTIEHPIYHDGVYVVHAAGGRYRTKLAVK